MASNESGLQNGTRSKPLKELKHPEKFREQLLDASNGVDSGIGSSLSYSINDTDRSCTDTNSIDGQSRNQECGATAELTKETKKLNIKDNTRDDIGQYDYTYSKEFPSVSNSDEGYKSISSEVSLNFLKFWSRNLRNFAQSSDIRYLLKSHWSLLLDQNDDGDTSLHLAVINGDERSSSAMLDVLPKLPAYLDIYNNLTQTPLHLAVITRQPKIVQKLINHGASVDVVDRNGQTCVHLACQRGDLNTLRAIFKPRPSRVDLNEKLQDVLEMRNFDGLTPLLVAVKGKHIELVKELITLGADVNAIDSKNGNSALHMAVEDNNLPMVSHLLFKGNANPNAMSYSGSTPLHIAAGLQLKTIVATLIAVGASTSIENFEGDTAFTCNTDEDFSDDDPWVEEMED